MADDLDPQRVFERFSSAYDKPKRRRRGRLSLFPWVPGGPRGPIISMSSTAVSEDASIGTVVGTPSVSNLPDGVTVSSWSITADPDTKFDLDGSDDLITEATLDYETATSHSVTLQATLSDASTVSRAFTISVTDVADVVPSQFGTDDWSVADAETSGDITITITTLPDPGDSEITDLQYQIDGGTWTSLGGTTTGDYGVSGLTDDVEVAVAVRAVNAAGNGTGSATKNVTPTDGGAVAAGDSLALFNEGGVTLLHTGMI